MYGIFTYIYHKYQPNVDKYASPMDGMGGGLLKGCTFAERQRWKHTAILPSEVGSYVIALSVIDPEFGLGILARFAFGCPRTEVRIHG